MTFYLEDYIYPSWPHPPVQNHHDVVVAVMGVASAQYRPGRAARHHQLDCVASLLAVLLF